MKKGKYFRRGFYMEALFNSHSSPFKVEDNKAQRVEALLPS